MWDRRLTVAELEAVLARPDHPEFVDLLALTLRQARPEEVWRFIRPEQVAREFARVESRLGRRRAFWRWLLDALAGCDRFYLTGGAALAAFHLHHRRSDDLDLFSDELEAVSRISRKLSQVCSDAGWTCTQIETAPGYRRFVVADGREKTVVDVIHEPVRQVVAFEEKPLVGRLRVDALDDLIANKLAALLGRGDVKDLVDLYFFERKLGLDVLDHLEQARLKDGGVEPSTLAWVLRSMQVDTTRLLLASELQSDQLASFRDDLVRRLLEMSWPS